jgi:hypothetical protein
VLENKLFLIAGFEDHRVLIEAFDSAGQLDATHQVNGQEGLILPRIIEKSLLYVLLY